MTKEHFPYVAIVSVVAVVAVVILLLSLRTTTQAPAEQLAEEGAVERDALAFISTDPEIGAGKIQFKKTGTVRLQ